MVRETAPPSTDLGYPQVAAVIVDYDVELKHTSYMDANGPVVLEFWLVRESNAEPWLILNKGHPVVHQDGLPVSKTSGRAVA